MHVFRTNLRHQRDAARPAFRWPGFESREFPLHVHDLGVLLRESERATIDSRPRIVAADGEEFQPRDRLADLEHERLRAMMLPGVDSARRRGRAAASDESRERANASLWWDKAPSDALLTGVLPRNQPFRTSEIPTEDLVLRILDEDADDFELARRLDTPGGRQVIYETVEESLLKRLPERFGADRGIQHWEVGGYLPLLRELAGALNLDARRCALRYGTVSLPRHDAGWCYHPALGFAKRR